VPLQILDMWGSGDFYTAMRAIDYATQMRFPITNNSYGGTENLPVMEEVIRANRDAGSLFVAAAGNRGTNNDEEPFYPASYPVENILSVAATDHKDELASYSNFGRNTVHLAAPGSDILSLNTFGGYFKLSGTSMAAPQVAGVAALIKSLHPDWGYSQLKERILSSVDVVEGSPWTTQVASGGRLNAARAVGGVASPIPLRLELSSITPNVGPVEGGTRVTLRGIDFSPSVSVLIGSKACTEVSWVSKLEINCILPPGRPVLHNVIAYNPDGIRKTIRNAFLYHPEPKITSLTPSQGSKKAGNELKVIGANFFQGAKIKIGEVLCPNVQLISSTELRCRLPEQPVGEYLVKVENHKGQESRQDIRYRYQPQPEIQSLSPQRGPLAGKTTLTLTGVDFTSGARVSVGGRACTGPSLITSNQLKCRVPKGAKRGGVPVTVTNPNGISSEPSTYTYR